MKLLKIIASGIPLFNQKCEIDFLSLQRVTEENAEKMSNPFSSSARPFYQNNVMSFIGINASGKTTILKLITFICQMLNNEPLNKIDCAEILDGLNENENICFETYFSTDNKSSSAENGFDVHYLKTEIVKQNRKLVIVGETLKSKSSSKVSSKKSLFDFTNSFLTLTRQSDNVFLLDDVSIMVAFNKKNNEKVIFSDMLKYTNINQLSISNDCPLELISFFDPSVEYLKFKNNGKEINICLKFKGKEEIVLNQLSEVNRYLSSGTIKGINTFLNAINVFKTGGYLIVDELENHFNREIVSTLMRFFMDKKVNRNGAMLIFSTHYSELLDEFERNDNIYIVRNRQGITVDNLSTLLKRNDIKKSDAYQSGFLEGTVPMYDAYMNLKKVLKYSY